MSWKSLQVHYKNKYPKCQVKFSETSFDVFDQSGEHHLISLNKNGAGQIVCNSESDGCFEKHDLSPIPKEARVYKLYKDNKVAPSEEYDERKQWVKENAKVAAHGYLVVESEKEYEISKQLKDASAKKKYEAEKAEYEAGKKNS